MIVYDLWKQFGQSCWKRNLIKGLFALAKLLTAVPASQYQPTKVCRCSLQLSLYPLIQLRKPFKAEIYRFLTWHGKEASIQPNLEHLSQYLMPYWLDTCITKQCCKSDTISNISEHQRDVIYEVNKQVVLQFATWQTEAVVRSSPSSPPPSHAHKS